MFFQPKRQKEAVARLMLNILHWFWFPTVIIVQRKMMTLSLKKQVTVQMKNHH